MALPEFCTKFAKNLCKPQIDHVIGLIFLIAVGVVAFFVVGMSLTIIFKGHYMESEIGENRHMKARGIRCASQQLREEEAALRGDSSADDGACSGGSCSSCTVVSCDGPDRGGSR